MKLARVFLPILLLLTLGAGLLAFVSASSTVEAPDGSAGITAANSAFELNGETSENVYQQQVVALWGIKDMTEVTAQQNVTIIRAQVEMLKAQNQLVAFSRGTLVVLVLLTAVIGLLGTVWLRTKSHPVPATDSSAPPAPDLSGPDTTTPAQH